MRKPKMFALPFWLLSMALVCACNAQGAFEDAETSNDYMSGNTQQQFDLRHTIPGEPEVDYPIYSEVPSTSFECTGKHEGYYADMETRCQVFRICTHTARSIHGFGFLCPNGTLFSQKNFVCDWYRNVNCDESEQYFSKNSANRIGSSSDMLERVRQMMEYPMKTISQALQQRPVVLQTSHHTLKKQLELAESGLDVSESDAVQESRRDSSQGAYLARKQPVTRAPVESVESVSQNYNEKQQTQLGDVVTQQRKRLQQQRQQQRNETKSQNSNSAELVRSKTQAKQITQVTQVKSASKPEGDDVYVNSLGELSSDPGVSFMHDTAHIIAEAPSDAKSYQKQQNFAEKVNVALNDLTELPADEVIAPDYVKSLRQPNEDLVLAANINNLLEEVADDLDPSISGYQVPAPSKNKSSFRFLSRGFSSQSDRAKRPPYEYAKPKQTASTIRFTNFRSQQQSSGLSTAVAYQTAPSAAMSRSLSVDSDARAIGNSVTQSYNKLPPQAPAQLTPPQRTQQLSQIKNAHVPTSPTPRIVIARAEGQRIAPNSVSSIISSLVMQPTIKPTTNTAYVALDDFLTKKFGQTTTSYTKTNTATKLTTSERNRHQIVQPPQQQYNQKLQSNFQAVAATATTNPAQSQIQQQQKLPAQKQQFSQHFSQQFQQTQQQQKQLQQLAQQQQLEQLQQLQQQQQKIQQQQLIQQQQKQQQQYAQQQLKEQQYFQQFTINARPQVQQQQQQQAPKSIQQQFGGNSIYAAPQQQQQLALQQQKSTSWHYQQQQQQVSQHKQSQQYAQEKQTQSQQQYQPQKSTSTQFYYPQQQQQQQTSPFTSNFFSIFNQRQQPQLPQFPPLGNTAASATFESPTPAQQQFPSAILSNSIVPPEHDKHVNIQLPALTVGLIPAPTALTLTAQRRMDVGAAADVDSSSASKEALGDDGGAYTGVSSYDVPLSSIGRLPNDITNLLRRLRKVK
ncbi:putative mediator of RNA polymerase II transcription subunit 12 [Rhagoletis pomonella]|uniref:putative mediator of RNA polymerase II transcription subunit 12 n=1 Tax=Rhagoletis pomonella TaxID=28610 RepID=UPI0017839F00|nr:putative mediator of RNA polymerase II transcription subunit 12 [Rhagoletis pomonella]